MLSLQRVVQLDLVICQEVNRACTYEYLRRFFACVSWLGDGKFWYAFMLVLPLLFGEQGLVVAFRMAACGILGVTIYKLIKHSTHRPRPYVAHSSIQLGAAPLDQYSFPSGHTLHAVMFTLIAGSAFPVCLWVLLPFTVLAALSRVVLGLHYPTDVLLGAMLGVGLALLIPPLLPF